MPPEIVTKEKELKNMDNDFMTGFVAGQSDNNNNNGYANGMWGMEWMWIFVIFALMGWGGNGFGGFGGGIGRGNCATTADIADAFNFNQLDNGIRGLERGFCDSTFALNNAITSGFSQAELSRCNNMATLMQQLNTMSFQMQQCCCELQGAIKDTRYDIAKASCDIIQNSHNDTDRILARLDAMETSRLQEKVAEQQAEIQNLRFAASQSAQNGYIDAIGNSIVARLQQPTPQPAYVVPAPYPYCGNNNGCCGNNWNNNCNC